MKRSLKPLVWSIDIFVQGVVTGNATVSMSLSDWFGFLQSPGLREPPVWIQDSPSDIHCIQWSNHFIYWSLQAWIKWSMITFDIWFQNIFWLIRAQLSDVTGFAMMSQVDLNPPGIDGSQFETMLAGDSFSSFFRLLVQKFLCQGQVLWNNTEP